MSAFPESDEPTVTLDGLVLNRADDDLDGFWIEEWDWDDNPDMRRSPTGRPEGHGEFDAQGYLSGRNISLSGGCAADSAQDLNDLGDRIRGILADGDQGVFTVKRSGRTLWSKVRLSSLGPTRFKPTANPLYGRWDMQLWAADPRKYGDSETFEQRPAFHRGNFPARPIHHVQGVLPGGYTIAGPTGEYKVIRALDAGHEHTIDMRDGFLRVDGVVDLGGVERGDIWTLKPGQQYEFTATNLAVLKTEVTDTYI